MNDKKMYLLGIIALVIIIILLLLSSKIYIKREEKIPESTLTQIETSKWPVENVPILNKSNIKIYRHSDELQMQEIPSGVTLNEYIDYLGKLSEAGFVADENFGCKDPSMINLSALDESVEEFTWMGRKDDYYIIACWKKEGTNALIDNVYIELSRITYD